MNKETAAFMVVGGLVTGAVARALQEMAKAEGVTVSELVRRAIAHTYNLDSGVIRKPGYHTWDSPEDTAQSVKTNNKAGNSHAQSQESRESQEAREAQAAAS